MNRKKPKRNINIFICCKQLNKIPPTQILTEKIQYVFYTYILGLLNFIYVLFYLRFIFPINTDTKNQYSGNLTL